MNKKVVIGVDLDNTIICFDKLTYQIAVKHGYIEKKYKKSKKLIRDTIRNLQDGEIKWQNIQKEIYGLQISQAHVFPGVKEFFQEAKNRKIIINIISHKSNTAVYGPWKIELRKYALEFLDQNGFFSKDGINISEDNIFFKDTRVGKVKTIAKLGCTHFIDDLMEVFLEPMFPKSTVKILFDPHNLYPEDNKLIIFHSWKKIHEYFFK